MVQSQAPYVYCSSQKWSETTLQPSHPQEREDVTEEGVMVISKIHLTTLCLAKILNPEPPQKFITFFFNHKLKVTQCSTIWHIQQIIELVPCRPIQLQ